MGPVLVDVDPAALGQAHVVTTLGLMLFESDPTQLGMALTAITNIVRVGSDSKVGGGALVAALLEAGVAQACPGLLNHPDGAVREQAVDACVHLSDDPLVAAALAQAGAAVVFVSLVDASEPNAAVPLARALGAMASDDDQARASAVAAGGVKALGTVLLGCTEAEGRLTLALALATLVRADWSALQVACGWEAVMVTLCVAAGAASPSMHALADAATEPLLMAIDEVQGPRGATQAGTVSRPLAASGAAPDATPGAPPRPMAPPKVYSFDSADDAPRPSTRNDLRKPSPINADLD